MREKQQLLLESPACRFASLMSIELSHYPDKALSCTGNPEWLTPNPPPFVIPNIYFFACTYDADKIDFTHNSISQIAIPSSLSNVIHKRKAEYIVGRYCAQHALKMMGSCQPVDRHPDRSPKWPSSLLGSITHTRHFSMAAVGSKEKWKGIGIDTEIISPTTQIETFSEQFITPFEFDLGINSGFTHELCLYTVFSAKESVFKSLYPLVKSYFGFFDVQVISIDKIDSNHGTLVIRLIKPLPPFDENFLLSCFYLITNNYIHTMVAF